MADAINGIRLSDTFEPLSAYDEYGRRVKPPKYTRAEMNAMAEAARKADPNVVRGAIYDAVKGMGGDAGAASLASTVGSFMPVVGDLQDAEDSARAFKKGDYLTGALLAGALLAPGAAGALVKGGKKAAKGAAKTVAKEAAQETGERATRSAMADALDTSYRGNHLAPLRDDYNAPLHALNKVYPDDIYSRNASRYYGHGDAPLDNETVRILQAARGNPDAEISVFRAVPKGVKEINPGDWVTPNRTYAMQHGGAWVDDGAYDILEKKVRAGDLFTDGNSIHEFGYSPEVQQTDIRPKGIRAYHGSPHDFDRFDVSKIGTGEGAQAYGHGLYFADSEDVAREYRDALSRNMDSFDDPPRFKAFGNAEPKFIGPSDAQNIVNKGETAIRARMERIAADVSDLRGQAAREPDIAPILEDMISSYDGEMDELNTLLEQGWDNNRPPSGRMYEVNINANPDDFLDWDMPLSEQPQKVRDALGLTDEIGQWETVKDKYNRPIVQRKSGDGQIATITPSDNGKYYDVRVTPSGGNYYDKSVNTIDEGMAFADQYQGLDKRAGNSIVGRGAEEKLRAAGVPGIKYLDGMSRSVGEGSRNYVVFDDALIEIVRKYGIAAAVASGVISEEMARQMQAQGDI